MRNIVFIRNIPVQKHCQAKYFGGGGGEGGISVDFFLLIYMY